MSTIADFQTKMDEALKDTAGILTQSEKNIQIGRAVKLYSRHRPREIASDIAGSGIYEYPLPSAWIDGFSTLRSLEYPVGSQEPETVPLEDILIYRLPAGPKLRFLRISPAAGQTARLLHTVPHTVDATTSTIPVPDEDAVSLLAAASGCEALASYYAQSQDPTLTADVVDHKSKSADYAARAKRLKKLYAEAVGIKEEDITPAASGTRDWGSDYQWGEDRMLHPRDRR